MQEFFDNNKKLIIISIIVILIIIIALIVGVSLYNPISVSWEGEDSKILATRATELNIQANISDKKKRKYEVEWKVSDGKLDIINENQVKWDLPDEEGTYAISVSGANKTFTKYVTVLENKLGEIELQEGKSPKFIDTDKDGLDDDYEINISKTDLNNKDTDGDGMLDGTEVLLDLNPLEKVSKSDGIEDKNREVSYKTVDKDVAVNITGSGNITDTVIDEYNLNTITSQMSVVGNVYNIYTSGNIKEAVLNIKYNKDIANKKGIKADNLSIYEFDVQNSKFNKIESKLDTINSSITATINKPGKFFIADRTQLKSNISTKLMFVIDNSGSMYPSEEVTDSMENDLQFKRVDLSNKLIDKLNGDYKFGAGKFTFEYTNLVDITSDKESVKNKINSIKTENERFTGTYIGEALTGGLKQFQDKKDTDRKYIILLTDGKDTTNVKGYDSKKIENATKEAIEKGVKIYTIGLGKEVDKKVLGGISDQTGGKFYYAYNADILDEIFELISADINYNLIDIKDTVKDDSVILDNSGFSTKSDGMPIENFSTNVNKYGATYGMSLFSKLYYEKKLPESMKEITVKNLEDNKTLKADGYSSMPKNNGDISSQLSNYKFEDLNFLTKWPKDFMSTSVNKEVLAINDKYLKEMTDVGFLYYQFDYTKDKTYFKNYQGYSLDMSSKAYKDSISKADSNFVNAIYRLDILKYKSDNISFRDEPSKAYSQLKEMLNNLNPTILKLDKDYYVVAQRILVDISNPNKFSIEVYDSNYKGKRQYIDMERVKLVSSKNKLNEKYEYRFSYMGKDLHVYINIPNVEINV